MKKAFPFSRLAASAFLILCSANAICAGVRRESLSSESPVFSAQNLFHFHLPPLNSFSNAKSLNENIAPTPSDGGIREAIPDKFQARYRRWKQELTATEFGQKQWAEYAAAKNFILTITVSGKEGQGAGTTDYKWNEDGELIGATINLGSKIDKGFPDPIYFPVMNSIAAFSLPDEIGGETLAAAKIAHEFGHVNSTRKTNAELFQKQNRLMLDYNKILLSNGYNTRDERLLEMSVQMGGTPVEIWENREYWGEANAMRYLLERIDKEDFYCSILSKIKRNVKTFAREYENRFTEISESKTEDACCK